MTIRYLANGNTKVDYQSLHPVNHPATAEAYSMEIRTLPDMIPTTINTCQLIKIDYSLVITIRSKGCHQYIAQSFPIFMIAGLPHALQNATQIQDNNSLVHIPIGQQLQLNYTSYQAHSAAAVNNLPTYQEVEKMGF